MKKIVLFILIAIGILLIIFGVINLFFGVLDSPVILIYPGVSNDNLSNNTPWSPDYYYIITYKSVGTFIQNHPIDINFEIHKNLMKGNFNNENYSAILSSSNCYLYHYPEKEIFWNFPKGAIILNLESVEVLEGDRVLFGNEKILFLSHGDCEINLTIANSNGQSIILNQSIYISSLESWLTIKSNRYILSLTIILIGLTLFQISFQFYQKR